MSDLVSDERLTVMGLLAESWAGLTAKATAQLREHDLGDVGFEVLLRLGRSPEGALRMSDLTAQTSLTFSGITRVVDRLEGSGLVERRSCSFDRRITYAALTDEGRARLEASLPGHLAIIEEWLTGRLDPAALESFVSALRVVRDGVRPCATAGAERPVALGDRPSLSSRG